MFPIKVLVILIALTIFGGSAALVGYDIYLAAQLNRLLPHNRGLRREGAKVSASTEGRTFRSEINPRLASRL